MWGYHLVAWPLARFSTLCLHHFGYGRRRTRRYHVLLILGGCKERELAGAALSRGASRFNFQVDRLVLSSGASSHDELVDASGLAPNDIAVDTRAVSIL